MLRKGALAGEQTMAMFAFETPAAFPAMVIRQQIYGLKLAATADVAQTSGGGAAAVVSYPIAIVFQDDDTAELIVGGAGAGVDGCCCWHGGQISPQLGQLFWNGERRRWFHIEFIDKIVQNICVAWMRMGFGNGCEWD